MPNSSASSAAAKQEAAFLPNTHRARFLRKFGDHSNASKEEIERVTSAFNEEYGLGLRPAQMPKILAYVWGELTPAVIEKKDKPKFRRGNLRVLPRR